MSSRSFPCVLCDKRTKPADRRYLNGVNNKHLRKYLQKYFLITTTESDVICGKCRRTYYRQQAYQQPRVLNAQFSQEQTTLSTSILPSPKNITLPISSLGGSHSTCLVCNWRGPKMINVSSNARFLCFIYQNLIIPAGARCCPSHISDDTFTCESLELIKNINPRTTSDFNRTDILNLLNKVRETLLKSQSKRLNFDSSMSDPDIKNLTGIDNAAFNDFSSLSDICTRHASQKYQDFSWTL